MAQANVTANWTPSLDKSVTGQKLQITINGQQLPLVSLDPTVATYQFVANEKDAIHVELWATDGTLDSIHATADLTIPEITAPAGPTGLTLTWAPVPPTPTPPPS